MRVLLASLAFVACGAAVVLGTPVLDLVPPSKAPRRAEPPPWCHGLACPDYKVVSSSNDGYEERQYDSTSWVSTNVTGTSYAAATVTGFARLFAYISGTGNEANATLAMTAPVLTHVAAGLGPTCGDSFVISFFVPPDVQAPPPSSDQVAITSLPPQRLYVASFSGFATERTVVRRAAELAAALRRDGVELPDDAAFWTATYDSPFRLTNRHNEVWLAAPKQ